ncbi:MAG TPA: bifunctional GNAT family N-acetyltransferase/PLP-dependent aspartate aminotransferase family protein [Thermoanaerobaculia bacterium]
MIRLREVTPADAPALYRWRMDPETRQQFRDTREVPYEAHLAFVRRYFAPANTDRWLIVEAADEPVGAIALYDFSPDGAEAEWGRFVIAPEHRGKGWGRRSLELLIAHAREIGVRRLRCEVLAGNAVAEDLYRRLGFTETGAYQDGGRTFRRLSLTLTKEAYERGLRKRTMEEPIHLFVPTFRIDESLAEIRECLEKGWTGLGFKTVAFETAWREHTGLPHAHFLSSASAGLHLACKLLKEADGWQPGDEVITTPLTFVSTNHAILYEELRPVFADVDEYLCLDPRSVAARITPRTRAVCFVGLGGSSGRYEEIRDLCRARGLRLILDAAHMAGTRVHGRQAGWDADAAVFSFQAVKNLPTADSGMICFADPRLDEEVRKWTWLGINKDTYARTLQGGTYKWLYDVEHVGYKYHGNSIMAALGLVAIRYLEEDNEHRRRLAAWYDEDLATAPGVETVPMREGTTPSRHLYQVLVDDRDEVMAGMNRRNVFPGVHYRDNTLYRMYAYGDGTCPAARRASERLISLPMHLRLGREEVRRVAAALRDTVAKRTAERTA